MCPPFLHHDKMREVSLALRPVYHWEKIPLHISRAFSWSHSGLWDCRHSQTATRAGNVCHSSTCSRGSVHGFQFAPLQLHFLLWQQQQQQHCIHVSIATLAVLWLSCTWSWFFALNLTALLLIVDVRLWGSVKFLAQDRPVLYSHAVRLCTIPLVFYNFIECCIMLSVWGVFIVRDQHDEHFS